MITLQRSHRTAVKHELSTRTIAVPDKIIVTVFTHTNGNIVTLSMNGDGHEKYMLHMTQDRAEALIAAMQRTLAVAAEHPDGGMTFIHDDTDK